jgi:hypothetical protein
MPTITLPFDDSNPVVWSPDLSDATKIIVLRNTLYPQGMLGNLEDLSFMLDDESGEITFLNLSHVTRDYAVINISDVKNPIKIPFKVSISAAYEHNITYKTNPDIVIDTQAPQQWFTNQTDLKTVVAIREQNYKPLTDVTLHLREPDQTVHSFGFSTFNWWTFFQVFELKPDLITPFDISITSTQARDLEVIKV